MTTKLLAVAALLAAGAAQAIELPGIDFARVTDSTAEPSDRSSEPDNFRTIDGALYFSAAAPGLGVELYRTDGTPDGLRLVHDFAAGPASSNPVAVGKAGGQLIVSANDGVHGRQLWAVAPDGAATRLTADTFLDTSWAPTPLGNAGDRLLVHMPEGEVWTTDGTAAGTFDLRQATRVNIPLEPRCELDGALVLANGGSGAITGTLVRTDGTAAGTAQIASIDGVDRIDAEGVVMDGRCHLLFSGATTGWKLVESDGTAAGTRVSATGETGRPAGLASFRGALYIRTYDYADRRVRLLRRTPGTDAFAGVVDLPAGSISITRDLWHVGDRLAFAAEGRNGIYSTGLYVSDGTQAGTQQVFPAFGDWSGVARPAPGGLFVRNFPNAFHLDAATGTVTPMPPIDERFYQRGDTVNGVYVSYGRDAAGGEVWRSDGTAAGTARLYDLWPATIGSLQAMQGDGLAIGDAVYARTPQVSSGERGRANTVVRSDGTPGGLRRLPPGAHHAGRVQAIVPFGDGIAFSVSDPEGYTETRWYRADAMLAGATPLSPFLGRSTVEAMTTGNRVIFGCDSSPDFNLLCAVGTGDAIDVLLPSPFGASGLLPLGGIGGVAFFALQDTVWRSDGTAPGTFFLTLGGPAPPPRFEFTSAGVAFQGKVHFGICAQNGACRLVATDGSSGSLTVVAELPPQAKVRAMASLGGSYVFTTSQGAGRTQLWRSDGTTAGTQLLLNVGATDDGTLLAAVGGKAHLRTGCNSTGCVENWYVSDGTPAGTRQISLPLSVKPTGAFLGALGDQALLFPCMRPSTGIEPCVIDRDGEHAALLADVFPGPESSGAALSFVARTASGEVGLVLDDGVHGPELWRARLRADGIFADSFD